jgi:hypothetical protein
VVLIIIVQEYPAADESPPTPDRAAGRMVGRMQFLPMLDLRTATGLSAAAYLPGLPGDGRISVPLTWGGTKRAQLSSTRPCPRPDRPNRGGASISDA